MLTDLFLSSLFSFFLNLRVCATESTPQGGTREGLPPRPGGSGGAKPPWFVGGLGTGSPIGSAFSYVCKGLCFFHPLLRAPTECIPAELPPRRRQQRPVAASSSAKGGLRCTGSAASSPPSNGVQMPAPRARPRSLTKDEACALMHLHLHPFIHLAFYGGGVREGVA